DELLAELLRQPLRHHPRIGVADAARRVTGNNFRLPVRIGFCRGGCGQSRKSYGARSQLQEFAAAKFHVNPPIKTADYSALILANLFTLAHFSVSSAMNLPKSAGE